MAYSLTASSTKDLVWAHNSPTGIWPAQCFAGKDGAAVEAPHVVHDGNVGAILLPNQIWMPIVVQIRNRHDPPAGESPGQVFGTHDSVTIGPRHVPYVHSIGAVL